jgi:hypothetical protein
VFKYKLLGKIFGPKGGERTVRRKKLHTKNFTIYWWGDKIKQEGMGAACSMHGRDGKSIQTLSQKISRKETTCDLSVDGRIILKQILWTEDAGVWTGFN